MSASFLFALRLENSLQIRRRGNFLGGPLITSWSFHLKGPGFSPWSGNRDPTSCIVWPKKKKMWFKIFLGAWICYRKGNLFQGMRVGSCLTLGNELSEESHMLTKRESLLGRGAWAERRRARSQGGRPCHVARSLGFYRDGIPFWVFFGQTFWLGSDWVSIGVFLLTNLFHLEKIGV